ncbi:hypothetical protein NLU13_1785 [Sarocladium strictum]|uniref:Uncharacterized protein n=1 Tax=Sarocladium strictum TaxID=5046 RepID=A0AA39GTK9_SARSR|nr:hypothetical protein NLU13_1785 [Sarocladium strictum]
MFGKNGLVGTTFAAYNPRGRSVGGMLRVATMILILIVRTIHLAVYIARSAINARIAALVVGCIFGFLGTIFVAFSLAQLGAAQGKRRALGINWGRWHFDIILGLTLVVAAVLMIFSLITGGRNRNNGFFSAWCIQWVFISLFAWIAAKPGTTESYV